MLPHIKNYLKYFNYKSQNEIACEICVNRQADDIHHIQHRQKNNSELDKINNCIALCRQCHMDAHANKITKQQLIYVHNKVINNEKN